MPSNSGTITGAAEIDTDYAMGRGVSVALTATVVPDDSGVYHGGVIDLNLEENETIGTALLSVIISNTDPGTGLSDFDISSNAGELRLSGISSASISLLVAMTHNDNEGYGAGVAQMTVNGQTITNGPACSFGFVHDFGTYISFTQGSTFYPLYHSYDVENTTIDPESITISNGSGVATQRTYLSGTFDPGTFDYVPENMLYSFDGDPQFHPLDSLSIVGTTWNAIAPALALGGHTAKMQDGDRPWCVSNEFSFTVGPLPPLLVLDTGAGQLGGNAFYTGHVDNGVVTNLDVSLDSGEFEPAVDFSGGTPFTGQATADLAYGSHTIQARDHDNPSNESNTLTFSLEQFTQPVWPIDPTWQNGITERFEWLTDIMQSYSGAEQRRQLRKSPRRTFEMTHQPTREYRTAFDLALKRGGALLWYVPLWFERVRLTQALAAGTVSFSADTSYFEFWPGQLVVFWTSATLYEITRIAGITGGVISLQSGLQRAYRIGDSFMPANTAWLTAEPQATRYADQAAQATAQFTSDTFNDYTADLGTVQTYQGFPVLTAEPDEGTSATWRFQRIRFDFDPTTGVREVADTLGYGAQTFQYNMFAYGRQAYAALRAFFYALAGRMNLCWVPTFACDLMPTQDIGATDAAITVRRIDYETFATPDLPGRDAIMIATYDGNFFFSPVGAAAILDDGTCTIAITPIGTAVPVSNIKRISFIALSRSDTDTNEIMHHTDNDGVATASLVFREIPNNRTEQSFAFDPATANGGFLTDFNQVFNVTDPEETPFVRSAFAQTGGQVYVELEFAALNGGDNAGSAFGFGPAGLTFADIQAGATGGLFLITTAGGWNLYLNGSSALSGSGADFPGMVGLAVDFDAKEAWVRTFDTTRTDYSYKPPWNNDASPDPNVPGSGVSFASLTGPFYLFTATAYGVGMVSTLNAGYGPFLMPAPANYTAGWPSGD